VEAHVNDVSFFQVGNRYEFDYPRHNFFGIRSKLVRRRIQVTAVRDMRIQPIDVETVRLQPLLLRGNILVTGVDLATGEERSFYLSSMTSLSVLPEDELTTAAAGRMARQTSGSGCEGLSNTK